MRLCLIDCRRFPLSCRIDSGSKKRVSLFPNLNPWEFVKIRAMGIHDVRNLVALAGTESTAGSATGATNYESSEYGLWIEILIRGQ